MKEAPLAEFRLTNEQFAKIAPHLPTDTRDKERLDDRRASSGIIHVLKSGGRWTDAPRELYGPKKTPNLQYIVDPDQTRCPFYSKTIPDAFVVGAKLSVDLFTLAGVARGPGSL